VILHDVPEVYEPYVYGVPGNLNVINKGYMEITSMKVGRLRYTVHSSGPGSSLPPRELIYAP
jgi:hypothetical protein